ncbi:MAG: amidase [Alphaproteobacteria bacterium]|nr:amidase [Alphaproteobacteria bacterium]
MNAEDICYAPARILSSEIAAGRLTPVEIVDATIARAERLQPALNFVAVDRYEKARQEARAATEALAHGKATGPLHGIPITIKDNLATAGDPLTNGSHAFADVVAQADVTLAARLRAAGAIVVAKTTLPELAHKMLTDSPKYGITRNPWSLAHTPGGSSGGASAAVAAGVGALAVGTEGGGSIRCPAACAGILGLKATLGRIPAEFFAESFANFVFAGPMCRDVEDLSVMLSIMSGEDRRDPHSLGVAPFAPASATGTPLGMKIGWLPRFGAYPIDPEVAQACEVTIKALQRDGGAEADDVETKLFDDVFEYYVVIATASRATLTPPLLARHGDRMTDTIKDMVRQGAGYSAVDWQKASDRRTVLFRGVQELLTRYDVLAMPTLLSPAKPVDAGGAMNTPMYAEWCAPLYPFNLTGHPALSIPCGWNAEGLPIGLQLVGRWYDEARLLSIARWIETAQPWAQRRPPV